MYLWKIEFLKFIDFLIKSYFLWWNTMITIQRHLAVSQIHLLLHSLKSTIPSNSAFSSRRLLLGCKLIYLQRFYCSRCACQRWIIFWIRLIRILRGNMVAIWMYRSCGAHSRWIYRLEWLLRRWRHPRVGIARIKILYQIRAGRLWLFRCRAQICRRKRDMRLRLSY